MKETKTIVYGDEARQRLLDGVQAIAKAVKITLGPSGKNALIRQAFDTKPFATKDGVTVAGQMFIDDYVGRMAIESLQDVANNADSKAGDGTTTATVLAEAMFEEGIKRIKNCNPIEFQRGISMAVGAVVKELKKRAISVNTEKDIKRLRQVALIASNNDENIADIVIDAFKVAGNQGVVNIKRSKTRETYLTTIDGMNLPVGYRSVYYINDHKHQIVDFDKPFIYMTNEKITSISDNLDMLLQYVSKEQIPLLIICKDIDEAISENFIYNKSKNTLKICVCKAPGFGQEQVELLKDLGVVLGKEPFLENELDFNSIPADELMGYLPRVDNVIVTDQSLSIKEPIVNDEEFQEIEEAKKARADKLREQLKTDITAYEKGILQTRISRLTDGIAYINIGAISDIEFNEKQHRIQDALYSVKSAYEEGIVPGGGCALNFIGNNMNFDHTKMSESEYEGACLLLEILHFPFMQILQNTGITLSEEAYKAISHNWNYGIDARTQKQSNDMIKDGIIDAVKVTRVALENSASVVSMLLTTELVVIDNSAYEQQSQKSMY